MFHARAVLLALSVAVVGLVSTSSPVDAAQIRPYAPELFDRSLLTHDEKRSLADDARRPYSPDLYFRDALLNEEPAVVEKRSVAESHEPTKMYKRAVAGTSTQPYGHVFGRRLDGLSEEDNEKRWFWPVPSGAPWNPIQLKEQLIEAKKEKLRQLLGKN